MTSLFYEALMLQSIDITKHWYYKKKFDADHSEGLKG